MYPCGLTPAPSGVLRMTDEHIRVERQDLRSAVGIKLGNPDEIVILLLALRDQESTALMSRY